MKLCNVIASFRIIYNVSNLTAKLFFFFQDLIFLQKLNGKQQGSYPFRIPFSVYLCFRYMRTQEFQNYVSCSIADVRTDPKMNNSVISFCLIYYNESLWSVKNNDSVFLELGLALESAGALVTHRLPQPNSGVFESVVLGEPATCRAMQICWFRLHFENCGSNGNVTAWSLLVGLKSVSVFTLCVWKRNHKINAGIFYEEHILRKIIFKKPCYLL